MAADLHIHTMRGVTEDDLRCFKAHVLTSKYFDLHRVPCSKSYDCRHYRAIVDSEQIWVGEVSFLKAMLLEDTETYVPSTIQAVVNLIGENQPIIDDEFITKIRAAFGENNDTVYSLADVKDVVEFLEANKGQKVFTVSW